MIRLLPLLLALFAGPFLSGPACDAGDLRDEPIDFSKIPAESVFKVLVAREGASQREAGILVLTTEQRGEDLVLRDATERPDDVTQMPALELIVHRDGLLSPRELRIGDLRAAVKEGKLVATMNGREESEPFDPSTLTLSAAMRIVPLLSAERGSHWAIVGPLDLMTGKGAQDSSNLACQGAQRFSFRGRETEGVAFTAGEYQFFVVDGRLAQLVMKHGSLIFESTDEKPYSRRNEVLPEIAVKAVPFQQAIALRERQAVILRLPDGKSLALWCLPQGRIGLDLNGRQLSLSWGEEAFKELRFEEVPQEDGTTATGGYKDSYIRQGSVRTSDRDVVIGYTLWASKYRVEIADEKDEAGTKSLQVSVVEATESELLTPRDRREKFVQAMKSKDASERAKGLQGLSGVLDSTYAGKREDNIALIRPLLEDPESRDLALQCLLRLQDRDAAMQVLGSVPAKPWDGYDAGQRFGCLFRSASDDSRITTKTLDLLASNQAQVRDFALGFLSEACIEAAREPLERLLDDPAPLTRARAVEDLMGCAPVAARAEDLQRALEDDAPEVLHVALREASKYNRDLDLACIFDLLANGDEETRRMAAYALDCCDRPEARDPLLAATRDAAPTVRAQAATSLGRAGFKDAYDRLVEMMKDSEPRVRSDAVNALRWLGDARAVVEIQRLMETETDRDVRNMAERTLRELGDR